MKIQAVLIDGFKNLSEVQIAKKERLTKKCFEKRLKKLKISYFPVDSAKNLCIVQANVLCLNKIR